MPPRNRVVITGLGILSPIGSGKEAFWEALRAGRCAIRRVDKFDPSPYPTQFAAQLNGFDFSVYIDPKWSRRMDLTSQMAVSAAKMAVKDSHLDLGQQDRERMGVVVGTAMAGHAFMLEQHDVLIEGDEPHARKLLKAAAMTYVSASLMSLLNIARWWAILRR